MVILINASNLKKGGGLQVADSLCCSLDKFPQHQFVVVLSSCLEATSVRISQYNNVIIKRYDIRNNINTLLLGRDAFLDSIVRDLSVNCVLTIFGPSRWNPKCPHLSGFARLQLVCPESPFFRKMSIIDKLKSDFSNTIIRYLFKRSTKYFYSENAWVSSRVENLFRGSSCKTITNYYNQVFDSTNKWADFQLPEFSGFTILNVGENYPHKNLGITLDMARILKNKTGRKFRFVLTVSSEEFDVPDDLKDSFVLIGRVDITECPSLYQQADVMLQPSLLECFSATYPEAMRMGIPIVTTDLEFAHSLCENAALYYSALDASDAADKILIIVENLDVRRALITLGKQRLLAFDDYSERSRKLIDLCESIVKDCPR